MRASSSAGFDIWEAVDGIRDAFASRPMGRTGRMGRGDIRTAILVALAEEPMHGYQIIQAIDARTGGAWKPSPGSIYPTLQLLADEGLVTAAQEGERKVYSLTDTGRAAATAASADGPLPWEPRRVRDDERLALPKAGAKLAQAMSQVAHSGTPEQAERATAIVDEARRKLYAILAEE
ncbi:MAG: PadR family transcriptional regulator [Schumannella sp.]|nr:PadR family transcriptional regulator [Schumannella sp.]